MAKKAQKTILITGATGKQGHAVIQHLQKTKFSLRLMTRDPQKPAARALVGKGVDVGHGDFEDPASLVRALEDADGVFGVQDWVGGPEAEVREGVNLIEAARKAGVSHLIYSSVSSADKKTGVPHFESKFEIEERLRASGVPYTVFRPVFFMENWLQNRESIDQGTLAMPLRPETELQMIAVDDIGAFVAAAFERPGKWLGKTLDIAGDALPLADIAKAFATSTGHEVQYRQMPLDDFKKQAGEELAAMFHRLDTVGFDVNIEELRQEMPNLTSFERWLNTTWQSAGEGGKEQVAKA